jgi:hypothetical protein
MPHSARKLLLAAALCCFLPLAVGAEGDPEPPESAAAPAAPEKLEGVTAYVLQVRADGLLIRRAGTATDPKVPRRFGVARGRRTKVSGQGKSRWLDLRKGDLVLVSYVKGDPPEARRINVLPPQRVVDPLLAAAAGLAPSKPKDRSFVGYVKRKEGDLLDVMDPYGPPGPQRRAVVKQFIRHDGTSVELLRDSWDELRKGDRLTITFQKGNPRPADRVQVIWRGGEKPLPPGVATRLYDPEYDKSVRDVDGIGETSPVYVRKPVLPKVKIKIPRQ